MRDNDSIILEETYKQIKEGRGYGTAQPMVDSIMSFLVSPEGEDFKESMVEYPERLEIVLKAIGHIIRHAVQNPGAALMPSTHPNTAGLVAKRIQRDNERSYDNM